MTRATTSRRWRGCPRGGTPTLFDRDLLVWLGEAELPSLPPGAVAAVHRLYQVSRTIQEELPFPLRIRPFEGGQAYGSDGVDLPRAIDLDTPRDVAMLREALRRLDRPADPLAGFRLWKGERIRRAEGDRAAPRPSLVWNDTTGAPPADARTRILYVSNPSGFSGAEESLCQMMNHLDRRRFALTAVVALDGTFADRLREVGATVIVRGTEFGWPTVANLAFAMDTLRRTRPAIVHLNADDGTNFAAAAKLLGLPVVLHVRNGVMAPYEDVAQHADAIITVSDFLRREILSFDIPLERVRTIYDEVDCAQFRKGTWRRGEVRRELGIPAQAEVALMIARYAPNKRHDLMLAAAARARAAIPALHLVLKGDIYSQADADLRAELEEQAEALGLSDAITWVRFVPDIRMLHEAADVLVLCSDREGLGRCVVEAMALELPVVVTDSGGSHELVGGGERGYRVRGGDATDLAQRMVEALTSRARSQAMAAAARRFAETELDARVSARRMTETYEALTRPRVTASNATRAAAPALP